MVSYNDYNKIENNSDSDQVAIIIPVYNAEEYISDCLESLIAQTYTHWVAYCVNDGSKDKSLTILNEYAERDSRIKVFDKRNGGASSARNFALNHLEGEDWVSFIDSDDYIAPTMYEDIIRAIKSNSKIEYVRLYCEQTPKRYNEKNKEFCNDTGILKFNIVEVDEYFKFGIPGGYTHSLFVKASVVKNHSVRFPEDMTVLEDQVFSLTCASYCTRFLLLEAPRNYYYFIDNSTSITSQKKLIIDDYIRCVNYVYKAFSKNNLDGVISNYFYKSYLPDKMTGYYNNLLKSTQKPEVSLDREINFSITSLGVKTLVKYWFCKIKGF